MSDIPLKIGHLKTADASKIGTIPVAEGNVIYSEGPAMQFIDFASKRHTYGSVLSGIYSNNTFVDFSTSAVSAALTALLNSNTPSGQLLLIGGRQALYQKLHGFAYLKYFDVDLSSKYFITCKTKITSSDTVNIIVYGINGTDNSTGSLYYLTISGSTIKSVIDLDGMDVSGAFSVIANSDGFSLSSTTLKFKIVSSSCSNGNDVLIFNDMGSAS